MEPKTSKKAVLGGVGEGSLHKGRCQVAASQHEQVGGRGHLLVLIDCRLTFLPDDLQFVHTISPPNKLIRHSNYCDTPQVSRASVGRTLTQLQKRVFLPHTACKC